MGELHDLVLLSQTKQEFLDERNLGSLLLALFFATTGIISFLMLALCRLCYKHYFALETFACLSQVWRVESIEATQSHDLFVSSGGNYARGDI